MSTLLVQPTISMTLQELFEMQQLLLEHEAVLAPSADDPLHQLLSQLARAAMPNHLMGTLSEAPGNTGICLTLTNHRGPCVEDKEEEQEDKDKDAKLFARTKNLLLDVLRCSSSSSSTDIHQLAIGATTAAQEAEYKRLLATRARHEEQAMQARHALAMNQPMQPLRTSLHEVKTRLSHNLRRLENAGLASRADNYQALVTALAADVAGAGRRQAERRQEAQRLSATSAQLEAKEHFCAEQLNSYKTYLDTCLRNLTSRSQVHGSTAPLGVNRTNGKQQQQRPRHKAVKTVKYSAVKLMEKGVLLEVGRASWKI